MQSNRLQLNARKTELMWCVSLRRRHSLPAEQPLINQVTYYQPSEKRAISACILIELFMRAHITSLSLWALALELCGSYIVSGDHCPSPHLRHLRRPSSWRRWTTVTLHWQVFLGVTLIDCRLSSTLLHVSQPTHASSITSHRRWSTCIGYESQSGFYIQVVCADTSLSVWLRTVVPDRFDSTRRHDWIATPPSVCIDRAADRTFHATICDRSFAVAAPRTWNNLPETPRRLSSRLQFKEHLKTYFFERLSSRTDKFLLWTTLEVHGLCCLQWYTNCLNYITLHYITVVLYRHTLGIKKSPRLCITVDSSIRRVIGVFNFTTCGRRYRRSCRVSSAMPNIFWRLKTSIPWAVRLSWIENDYSGPLSRRAILNRKVGQTELATICATLVNIHSRHADRGAQTHTLNSILTSLYEELSS